MNNFLFCPRHGKVEGSFCRMCRTQRYLAKIRAGTLEPKELIEDNDFPENELLPLQIRFRAFVERSKRNPDRAHSWEQRSRMIRVISTKQLGDVL